MVASTAQVGIIISKFNCRRKGNWEELVDLCAGSLVTIAYPSGVNYRHLADNIPIVYQMKLLCRWNAVHGRPN